MRHTKTTPLSTPNANLLQCQCPPKSAVKGNPCRTSWLPAQSTLICPAPLAPTFL